MTTIELAKKIKKCKSPVYVQADLGQYFAWVKVNKKDLIESLERGTDIETDMNLVMVGEYFQLMRE